MICRPLRSAVVAPIGNPAAHTTSSKMKNFLTTVIATAAVLAATAAHANTYIYMCRVGHASYPVTLTTPDEENAEGDESMNGGTWRGTVFHNVRLAEGCRYNFVATRDGVTAELCTATQGVADLKIGKATVECQMRAR
jgi:hypothetical protein